MTSSGAQPANPEPNATPKPGFAKASAFIVVFWIIAAVLVSGAVYTLIASGHLSWSSAVAARADLAQWVSTHLWLACIAYAALFVLASLLLFPAQLWIIVFGAILLGFTRGLAITWIAACLSALLLHYLAKGALADFYRRHAHKYLAGIEAAFQRDQFSYILAMRLLPVFPYALANVAPALLGARTASFMLATAIGLIPYVSVYAFVGARAVSMLDPAHPPDLSSLAGALIPIAAALAILPLIAIFVRRRAGAKPESNKG